MYLINEIDEMQIIDKNKFKYLLYADETEFPTWAEWALNPNNTATYQQ